VNAGTWNTGTQKRFILRRRGIVLPYHIFKDPPRLLVKLDILRGRSVFAAPRDIDVAERG
jgi:hypothetical protein